MGSAYVNCCSNDSQKIKLDNLDEMNSNSNVLLSPDKKKEEQSFTQMTNPDIMLSLVQKTKNIKHIQLTNNLQTLYSCESALNLKYAPQSRKTPNKMYKRGNIETTNSLGDKFVSVESFTDKELVENPRSLTKTPEPNHIITEEEEIQIRHALSNHFALKEINSEVLSFILSDLIYMSISKGKIVYEEGDEGNYFYIILSGQVSATSGGKLLKIYSQWECFGDICLITKCKMLFNSGEARAPTLRLSFVTC